MQCGIAGLGMTSAVTEGIELLGIAEVEPGLLAHPSSEPALESAVLQRRERSERQPIGGARHVGFPPDDQYDRLVVRDRDDRSVETDLDTRSLAAGCLFRLTLGQPGRAF